MADWRCQKMGAAAAVLVATLVPGADIEAEAQTLLNHLAETEKVPKTCIGSACPQFHIAVMVWTSLCGAISVTNDDAPEKRNKYIGCAIQMQLAVKRFVCGDTDEERLAKDTEDAMAAALSAIVGALVYMRTQNPQDAEACAFDSAVELVGVPTEWSTMRKQESLYDWAEERCNIVRF